MMFTWGLTQTSNNCAFLHQSSDDKIERVSDGYVIWSLPLFHFSDDSTLTLASSAKLSTSLIAVLWCNFFPTCEYQKKKIPLSQNYSAPLVIAQPWQTLVCTSHPWSDCCTARADRFLTSWAIGWAFIFQKIIVNSSENAVLCGATSVQLFCSLLITIKNQCYHNN